MHTAGFITGGPELLDSIAPLWRALCEHHAGISPDFADWFRNRDFADRRAEIVAQASSGMRVQLALVGSEAVGYCVSTLSADGTGEVNSIFVRDGCRGMGIGERLMRDAIDWLESQGATSVMLVVVQGNDKALQWYRRFGFAAKMAKIVMLKE